MRESAGTPFKGWFMGAGGGVADGICLQGLEACGPVGLVWRDPKNESEGCVEWQLQEKKHQTKKGLGFSEKTTRGSDWAGAITCKHLPIHADGCIGEACQGQQGDPPSQCLGHPTCWFPQLPGTVRSAQEAKPVSVWGMLTCSSSSQLRDLSPQPRVTPGKPNRKRLEDRTEEPQWRSDAGNQLGG